MRGHHNTGALTVIMQSLTYDGVAPTAMNMNNVRPTRKGLIALPQHVNMLCYQWGVVGKQMEHFHRRMGFDNSKSFNSSWPLSARTAMKS